MALDVHELTHRSCWSGHMPDEGMSGFHHACGSSSSLPLTFGSIGYTYGPPTDRVEVFVSLVLFLISYFIL